MKNVFILVLFIILIFVIGYAFQNTQKSINNCFLLLPANVKEENLDVVAHFDNVTVLRVVESKGLYTRIGNYIIRKNGKMYMINSSQAYFFPWGFIASIQRSKTLNVQLIIMNLSQPKVNVTVQNKETTVRVKQLVACSYDRKLLWEYEAGVPYHWIIHYGEEMPSREGVSYPSILTSSTESYLFLVEIHSAPREVPSIRRWVGEDWVYIFGKNGLVKKLSLGKDSWPKRNVFISSAGNYTILGFEQPQEDGSPAYGRVLIFKGAEVIFNKTFSYKSGCLCYIIPGWGNIDENGYATFGLYTGIGIYNATSGKFTYKES
ncbi:hypothetical protein [Pyrococcus sp. ST04]|uniref:hypothetical protein n=1 Tax=Pyrococcus sp. ST04 TaxID=1183377 RepID=UPI001ED941AF|nr:hypothetical protein [Pyrococcus sp. ST04]